MKYFLVLVLITLTACTKSPNGKAQDTQRGNADYAPVTSSDRVTVERISVFRDDTAYDGTRAVYLVTDHKTGKEFIGISGVGVSETGTHSEVQNTVDSQGNIKTETLWHNDER